MSTISVSPLSVSCVSDVCGHKVLPSVCFTLCFETGLLFWPDSLVSKSKGAFFLHISILGLQAYDITPDFFPGFWEQTSWSHACKTNTLSASSVGDFILEEAPTVELSKMTSDPDS